MLTADARQAEFYQKQEEQSTRVSSAAALLAGFGDSGDGSTGSDGGSASVAAGSRSTAGASLRGSTGSKAGQMRLYRPNAARATPDREWQEWAVHQPAENQDSEGESISQVCVGGKNWLPRLQGIVVCFSGQFGIPPTDGSRFFGLRISS